MFNIEVAETFFNSAKENNAQITPDLLFERALSKSAKTAQIYQIIEKYHKASLDYFLASNVLREFRLCGCKTVL